MAIVYAAIRPGLFAFAVLLIIKPVTFIDRSVRMAIHSVSVGLIVVPHAIVDISDAVYLIAYIFSGGLAPDPVLAGDANCDNTVDISDVVYLIAYIFSGGQAPCAGCK